MLQIDSFLKSSERHSADNQINDSCLDVTSKNLSLYVITRFVVTSIIMTNLFQNCGNYVVQSKLLKANLQLIMFVGYVLVLKLKKNYENVERVKI